jgi:hypothetical protein
MTNIYNAIQLTTSELLDTIWQIPANRFMVSGVDGAWSPAQIAEHILKSETGVTRLFKTGSTTLTLRAPDQHVKAIEGIFLDFNAKYEAAVTLLPSDMPPTQTIVYKALQVNREDLLKLVELSDITLTYTDRSFPGLGTLTGLEWATVLVTHTQRHIHQLKNFT